MTTNVVLPVFVADSTLDRGGVELAPVVVDATLNDVGVELAAFVIDSTLDATELLNLPAFVLDSVGKARSLALPVLAPAPITIDCDLPAITCLLAESYGTLAASLPPITISTPEFYNSGGIAASVSKIGAVFSDSILNVEISSSLPRMTAVLGSIASTTGEIVGALSAPSVLIEGGEYGLQVTLPLLTSDLAPHDTATANISTQIPWITTDISGVTTALGGVAIDLPYVQAGFEAIAGQVASLQSDLRTVSSDINALLGASASLEAALELIEADITSAQQVSASISITLPSFTFTGTGYMSLAQVATYVVDTMNNAVTTYEAFPFNSFAEINGKYYGAGPAGLFELVGDRDDAVTPITAVVTTGHLHFGSEMQKRMSDFFVAMRASGDITLTITTDEVNSYEYTLTPLDIETLKQRRSLVGKGAKGKYWQFSLTNVDGCDFDFDSFNAAAVVLGRRL